MAWGTVETLLPPLRWAEIMGLSPWDFGQMRVPPQTHGCQDVWYQFPWQKNFLSRDEVSRAIAEAEFMFASKLGFWPAPKYFTNEEQPYPLQRVPHYTRFNRELDGARRAARLKWGYVRGGGSLARSLITANVAVTLSDADGDSYLDTFTLTVNTTVTDPDEIGVYVMDVDRLDQPISETWRLRPLRISFAGGVATIKGHIALLLKPSLAWNAVPVEVEPIAGNLLANLDVYRVYTDTTHTNDNSAQGYAVWEQIDCLEDDDCTLGTSSICIGDKRGDLGFVFVDFDPCETDFIAVGGEPTLLNLNYRAGYPLDANGQMDSVMADAIAKLATSLLPGLPCGCERSAKIISHWLSYPPVSGDNARFAAQDEINNPFGPMWGAVYAWRRVADLGISDIVSVN